MMAAEDQENEKVALLPPSQEEVDTQKRRQKMLLVSFCLMVVIGLGNKLFQKFQTAPMHNYPYFLSMYTTFVYVPLSFAYIWPMIMWGSAITKEQRSIPLYKFAIMGGLDGIAGVMQTFAVNYIFSGSLIVLLTQSAIPISMVISKFLLKAKYNIQHYVGAGIVVSGLIVVLVPQFVHPADGDHKEKPIVLMIWCFVLMLSCIPMTLSSVFKEKSLGETEIDVVYLNGWVAIFQLIITMALAVPSAYASDLTIKQLPKNFWDGMRCYAGYSTAHDDKCHQAPLFVNLYIAFNVLYNILIIMILKYGSSNLLWLAMTIMVPLTNVAFALPFVPNHVALTPWDIVGLVVIMVGLVIFRFWSKIYDLIQTYILRKGKPTLGEGNSQVN